MTNKDFYTLCCDQRKTEADPDRRTALTAAYHYMRECGATRSGVRDFLEHRIQECARTGMSSASYEWLGQVFAGAAPVTTPAGQISLFEEAEAESSHV